MVADVDDNTVESYEGLIILRNLRLVASRLYIKQVLPGPEHITYSCAIILSPSLEQISWAA